MRDEKLEPAHSVIQTFGGFEAVAKITGKHISRVYRWTYPKARGGTDGFIPQTDAEKLLEHARKLKLPITAANFFRSAA
jgi:hypothetical protein